MHLSMHRWGTGILWRYMDDIMFVTALADKATLSILHSLLTSMLSKALGISLCGQHRCYSYAWFHESASKRAAPSCTTIAVKVVSIVKRLTVLGLPTTRLTEPPRLCFATRPSIRAFLMLNPCGRVGAEGY